MATPNQFPLTQYSHGAGCGCKISPQVLDTILASDQVSPHFSSLLVGNQERDDAAVMELGDGSAIISTTDFFMPIVDDPFDFGRIASVNAISDVYAMGGTPMLAIAILGWPINTIPAEVAQQVIAGGRQACMDAGIPLAGGHSIDSPEPIFGLAVTGRVAVEDLKKNGGAQPGDYLFLTKPLGVGILSTAQKKGKLRSTDQFLARDSMIKLNKIGIALAKLPYVNAMTDVTGFGLIGHLREMMEASATSARIDFANVPLIDTAVIHHYLAEGCVPGGTNRNWASYGHKVGEVTDLQRNILCDPQTSGGLLVAISPDELTAFQQFQKNNGLELSPVGRVEEQKEKLVYVK
ncbi:selenide, water dikinase SelD [Lewinella sp. LCG006]|uniref:selenide, water dikinase SelD n=1 Tax=Lewinella sp. LCG006 TaxID=3231911 RepID=UPI0034616286